MSALWLGILTMISVSCISLISSRIYIRENEIKSELMSLASFTPAFIFSIIGLCFHPFHLQPKLIYAILIKNVLYCLSFYYRYESLRKFGPFVGAMMLGTQPIAVSMCGLIFLGEALTLAQSSSIFLVALALLFLVKAGNQSQNTVSKKDFVKYYALPTVASTLAIIWDRYFLNDNLSATDFFILDRILILPAFLIVTLLIQRRSIFELWQHNQVAVIKQNWKSLVLLGLAFTISVMAYTFALKIEKVAVVGLFRNSAYPVAAFVGAVSFRHRVLKNQWFSFALVVVAIILGSLS